MKLTRFFLATLILGLSMCSCSTKLQNTTWLPPIEKKGDLFWLARDSSVAVVTTKDSIPKHVQFYKKLTRATFDTCGCYEDIGVTFNDDGCITIITKMAFEISLGELSIGFEEYIPLNKFEVPEKATKMLSKLPFKHPRIEKLHGTIEVENEKEETTPPPKLQKRTTFI